MLFSTTKLSSSLADKSTKILTIFTKTIEDLKQVNQQAEAEIAEKERIINEAQEEKSSLQDLTLENNKIINNINSILS